MSKVDKWQPAHRSDVAKAGKRSTAQSVQNIHHRQISHSDLFASEGSANVTGSVCPYPCPDPDHRLCRPHAHPAHPSRHLAWAGATNSSAAEVFYRGHGPNPCPCPGHDHRARRHRHPDHRPRAPGRAHSTRRASGRHHVLYRGPEVPPPHGPSPRRLSRLPTHLRPSTQRPVAGERSP